METSRRVAVVTAAVTAFMMIAGVAMAGQSTSTRYVEAGAYKGGVEAIVKTCSDDDSGSCFNTEGTVKVSLKKLKDGRWVRLYTQTAKPEGDRFWRAVFAEAPNSGKCKLVARFEGTRKVEPSRGVTNGRCVDSNWLN